MVEREREGKIERERGRKAKREADQKGARRKKKKKKRIKRNSIEMETEISKKIDTITVLLKWSDRARKAIRQ